MFKTHLAVIKQGKLEFLEPIDVPEGTKVLVTLLQNEPNLEPSQDWTDFALQGLAGAYSETEPEYSLESLKELNRDYEGK